MRRCAFLRRAGLPPTELVPLVRARLTAINDMPVGKLKFVSDRANEFPEREANLTWSRKLARRQQDRRRRVVG